MEFKGLTNNEVLNLKKEGNVNKSKKVVYKSHLRIIYDSFFSFFNIILYVVAFIFLMLQNFHPDGINQIPLTKYGFLIIILANGLISLISEERSKRLIEKMEIVNDEIVKVIREGKIVEIHSKEIVQGDYLLLKVNETLNVDGIILKGSGSFNESIVTGESKNVFHKEKEEVISGSILSSLANNDEYLVIEVIKVGDETYIKKLENSVKKIKKGRSKLNKDIYRIILYMIFIMIPSFIIVLVKELFVHNFDFNFKVFIASSTIIVGMIPTGLVLLSSVTLANSIYKLLKEKVLTKELYAIERLARIDTLALDKTGTITSLYLVYEGMEIFDDSVNKEEINELMSFYLSKMSDNITSLALKKEFNLTNFEKYKYKDFKIINEFDSSIKYSSLKINNDIYKLGAFDILIKDERILENAKNKAKEGKRVLALSKNDEVLCCFYIKNELRKNIKEIIFYFNEMNINIKVISGDNLDTVRSVAKEAGIKGYLKAISLENIPLKDIKDIALNYDIFARATPEQKEEIIKTLEENHHSVGYIGDGVNDITSLRRASCSIALASGVKSSKLISDFTLLDDDFSHLVNVIKEGRRVVSNIKRTCTLFISKDVFMGIIALYSIFSSSGLVIEIESIYVFEFIIVALCGFLLSIENSRVDRIDPSIIKEALIKGFENGFLLSLGTAYLLIINAFYKLDNLDILISLTISLTGPFILFNTINKFNKYTTIVFVIGIFLTITVLFAFPDVFLDVGYLSSGSSLKDQINLLFKDFYNFDLFKKIGIYEYIIVLVFIIVIPSLYVMISKLINKKIIKQKM